MMKSAETKNQVMGVIVCKDCEKVIEQFESDRVVTQYGVRSCCKKE